MDILNSMIGGLGGPRATGVGADAANLAQIKGRHNTAAAARDARREVRELHDRVDRLTLVCMALWELLKERGELSEQDLASKVSEIDLRDGRADGKVARQVKRCASCGRVMSPRHEACMYCGAVNLHVTPFDAAL